MSSGFGVKHQSEVELFSHTPLLQSPEPRTREVEYYRPPLPLALEAPVGSPTCTSESWLEVQQILMESIKSGGKPLREVYQAALSRALGKTQTPSTTEPTSSVSKSSLVQGYPAGFKSDVKLQSQLDYFSQEDEAFSDHLLDEEFPLKGPYLTDEEEESE